MKIKEALYDLYIESPNFPFFWEGVKTFMTKETALKIYREFESKPNESFSEALKNIRKLIEEGKINV